MLKHRIICTLLWGETGLVKPKAFGEHRRRGSMMDAVRIMNKRNIDELIILDVTATPNKRGPRFEQLTEFTGECFAPVTVGGGVTGVEDAIGLLNSGADKVAVCSTQLTTIREISRKIGSQSVVGVLDVRYDVPWTHCGTKRLDCHPMIWAILLEQYGCGEILVTDMDRDGTLEGYNRKLITRIATAVTVPVIASGGCSGPEDMEMAFLLGADAVAAGALFQFTEHTPKSCAEQLHKAGIPVRLPPPPIKIGASDKS